jgi:hypothetical protein
MLYIDIHDDLRIFMNLGLFDHCYPLVALYTSIYNTVAKSYFVCVGLGSIFVAFASSPYLHIRFTKNKCQAIPILLNGIFNKETYRTLSSFVDYYYSNTDDDDTDDDDTDDDDTDDDDTDDDDTDDDDTDDDDTDDDDTDDEN